MVYVTDISFDELLAELINTMYQDRIKLIDHHGSAMKLNKYPWATVIEGNESGTSLFYNHLLEGKFLSKDTPKGLDLFVESVRRYDTWEWKTKYNDDFPSKLNMLLHIYGREKFIARTRTDPRFFTEYELDLMDLEISRNERYIESVLEGLTKRNITINDTKYRVGIVFAERNISDVGSEACLRNEDIDFCVIINLQTKSISYRCTKDGIDLGRDIATCFGGGGHPKSAGSSISNNKMSDIINTVLRRL